METRFDVFFSHWILLVEVTQVEQSHTKGGMGGGSIQSSKITQE